MKTQITFKEKKIRHTFKNEKYKGQEKTLKCIVVFLS